MHEQAKEAIEAARAKLGQPAEVGKGFSQSSTLQWLGWGVIVLGFGGLAAFVALPMLSQRSEPTGQSNPLEIPSARLFGYWEDKKQPGVDYWIARITEVQGNRFRIKWNGGLQRDGAGSGVGFGTGIIQPGGTVRIELAEELRQEPGRQPLLVLPGMGDGPKVQSLVLEGRYHQVGGGKSYFQGDYLERGARFYPYTRWVLETELPRGWTLPTGGHK